MADEYGKHVRTTARQMRGDVLDATKYGKKNAARLAAERSVPAHVRAEKAMQVIERDSAGDVAAATGGIGHGGTAAVRRRRAVRLRTAAKAAECIVRRLPDDAPADVRGRLSAYLDVLSYAADRAGRSVAAALDDRRQKNSRQQAGGGALRTGGSGAPPTQAAAWCKCGHGPEEHDGPDHDGACNAAVRQVYGFAGEGDVVLSCQCQGRVPPAAEAEVISIG